MEMAVENGNVNKSDVTVLAARITGYGIETPPENGPNCSLRPLAVANAFFNGRYAEQNGRSYLVDC